MLASLRGSNCRHTGLKAAYVMVEEAASERQQIELLEDSDEGVGYPCQRLDAKSQALIHRRMAVCALIATVSLAAVASLVISRPRAVPLLARPGSWWHAGLGSRLYGLADEEKSVNLYAKDLFYQSPLKKAEYDAAIHSSQGQLRDTLLSMREVATAFWVDSKAMIVGKNWSSLEGILEDASWKVTPELVTIVMHSLPNRDCGVEAASVEICCERRADGDCDLESQQGECSAAIREYKEEYVDVLVEVLNKYKGAVPISVVVEPSSLPDLVLGANRTRCGGSATRAAYHEGLRYAVEQLAEKTPWVPIYLGAANGGQLGRHELLVRFLSTLKDMRLPLRRVRGFATNIGEYRPLGKAACPWAPVNGTNAYCLGEGAGASCCEDPCGNSGRGSPASSELNYAQELAQTARALLGMDAHVLIDTSRNGLADAATSCASSDGACEFREAGAGRASTAQVHPSAASFVDAYFWIAGLRPHPGCSHQPVDVEAQRLAKHARLGGDEEAKALASMREQEEDAA